MSDRIWEAQAGRAFVGRLMTGSDLMDELERICAERNVAAGWVSVIGAVRVAAFAYYDQHALAYRELRSDTHHEIVGFTGNVSLRDGKPFIHAHATFADASGACVGGHLIHGIEVFSAEFTIREMAGVDLVRTFDEEIGLALW